MELFNDDYYQSYKNFIEAIEEGSQDLQWVYDRLDELVGQYPQILELSAAELFHDLYERSPLAAVALFGHSGTRPYFVLSKEDEKRLKETQEGYCSWSDSVFGSSSEECSPEFFRKLGATLQLHRFLSSPSFPEALGEDNYGTVDPSEYEDEGWINVEHKGRTFIILKWEDSCGSSKIRSVYSREGLEASEVTLSDVFDGFDIDVEDSSNNDNLIYMETR